MESILCLNKYETNIYDSIEYVIKHNKSEFSVSSGFDMDHVLNLVKIALAENSKGFYYDNCKISYSRFGKNYVVKLSKWLSPFSVGLYINKFNAESEKIINTIIKPGMNKLQKILAVHNYLIENVTYFGGIDGLSGYLHYHTAYGAIVDKCAVCEGIAAAFCHLLSLIEIRSTIVNGTTEQTGNYGHTWNIVEVDGKYYHFDVTWDLKNKDDNNFPCFDYFALKDNELNNRSWNRSLYPLCNADDLNFFQVTRAIANSDSELISIAKRQVLKSNGLYIKCPYLNYLKNDEQYWDYISNIIDTNHDLLSLMQGKMIFRVNKEQAVICVMRK